MFIEVIKNNGKDYLRLVHAIRKPNKNGDMVSTKKVLLNIGPLDRYDDGLPDYIGRLRKSFKAGVPLIPELKPYCEETKIAETYKFEIREGSNDCFGHPRLFFHVRLERISLRAYNGSSRSNRKIPWFDPN